jgi:membrane fusion protein, macrolide-specific efflux system
MRRIFAMFGCIVLIALVAACSKTPVPANPASGESRPVAIARGKVDIEGGLVHIASARDGIVSKLPVSIGDAVKAGDTLLVLDTTQVQMARDAAKVDLRAATAQAELLRAKLPSLKVRASRAQAAAQAGATSGQVSDDAQEALVELQAEMAVADAGIEAAKMKVRQADYEIEVRTLHAPVSGKIVSRNARVGDPVTPAATDLIELLPDAPRIVRAELNESFVSKVSVGMSAEIHAEADPDRTYSARVVRIGDVFGPSKLVENAQEATDVRDVECILELTDATLKVGERVQVKFVTGAATTQKN